MVTFNALERVKRLKRSSTRLVENMCMFIVYLPHEIPGQRFRIRKRSTVEKWNVAVAQSTFLKRGLTDGERDTAFAKSGSSNDTFKIFAATRKYQPLHETSSANE